MCQRQAFRREPEGTEERKKKKSSFQLEEKEFNMERMTDVLSNTNGSDQRKRSILQSTDREDV